MGMLEHFSETGGNGRLKRRWVVIEEEKLIWEVEE